MPLWLHVGYEMSNQEIIALLRDIATSAPLPMEMHERIVDAILALMEFEDAQAQ